MVICLKRGADCLYMVQSCPWVGLTHGLGQYFSVFGGLGWVHYTILLFCVDMNQQLACKILFYNYQSLGKYYEIFRSIVDICINRCEMLVIQS